MHNELTNLLPPERQRLLAREYVERLGVVSVALAIILVLISAVLLLPTYVFLIKSADAKETRLSAIDSTLSSANETTLSARLVSLTSDATTLKTLSEKPSASGVVRTVLGVPHLGVTLSSLSYTPAAGTTPGTLTISGSAATRDTLRSYQLALQGAPFALSAVLPVSAYAKDTDIAFTIIVTLAP